MAADEWDWSQHVVDHIDLHASDYEASVAFYAIVLTPLGIPSWPEDSEHERATCFTRVNVVDRRPPTRGLHVCFVARSREQVTELGDVLAGLAPGRRDDGETTVFDSTGLAIQDLAIALAAVERLDELDDVPRLRV